MNAKINLLLVLLFFLCLSSSNKIMFLYASKKNSLSLCVRSGFTRVVSPKSIFGDDFVGWAWLPFYDGKNEVTIEGNCSVTFEWREVRKVGSY